LLIYNIKPIINIFIAGDIMKKSLNFSVVICTIFFTNCEKLTEPLAQTSWHLIYTAPSDAEYKDIFFVDKNYGWVVGNTSNILHTKDGGNTWITQKVEDADRIYLNCVYFKDRQTGMAVGSDWSRTSTTDGGETWIDETQAPLPRLMLSWYSIFFIDSDYGWMTNSQSEVIYTRDGGLNWQDGSGIPNGSYLPSIYFINKLKGWTISNYGHKVFNSIDGGMTWNEQRVIDNSCDSSCRFNDIMFADELYGWICTMPYDGDESSIYHTSNGGQEWFCQTSILDSSLNAIYFINKKTGIVVGKNIYLTNDGGNTWDIEYFLSNDEFVSLSFVNGIGWALSKKGVICKYTVN
jgi:photosystem II stability/assembly factor-like uncharacterized protein